MVADGHIFDIPVKAFGGLETLVETFAKSDVVSNITINPRDCTIEVNRFSGNTPSHDGQKRSRPTIPKNVNVLGFNSQWEILQEFFGKADVGLFVIPDSFRGAIGGMVAGRYSLRETEIEL